MRTVVAPASLYSLRGDRQLIENLENAIGFSPSFNSINQALSVIESFLPMKQQGLGMTKQWQLTKIFKTLDSALKVRLLHSLHEGRGSNAHSQWISMSFPVDHQTPFDYPVIGASTNLFVYLRRLTSSEYLTAFTS